MGLIGHKLKICILVFAFVAFAWMLIPTDRCSAADGSASNDPNAVKVSADPNTDNSEKEDVNPTVETDDTDTTSTDDPNSLEESDDTEDVFNPKISTLVNINEAYESIFSPEFVTDKGLVRYAELRRKRSMLLGIIRDLDNINPAIVMSLSSDEKTAFWINAYNCCILDLIIENYPIQHKLYMIFYPNNSIMQITGDWQTKHFFDIQGLQYNLKEIEQEFLLDRTKDPRILFALSYASVGGALLRAEPYRAETLDEQLDDQVRRYLATPQGMIIDRSKNRLSLSNLFTMYDHKQLFLDSAFAEIKLFRERKPDERAWLNFIRNYLAEDDVKYLESSDPTIDFIKYDWLLNEGY